MAFPTSSAFVAANVLTAAQLNALRADLLATNGYAIKAADQSVTSSTVLVNDTHLLYTISNTGTYIFEAHLYAVSAANAAGDLSVGFSFPTGTCHFGVNGLNNTVASGSSTPGEHAGTLSATSGTTSLPLGLSTATTYQTVHGILVASATGTLRLMWAQFASNASASTLKAGSHMRVEQVA